MGRTELVIITAVILFTAFLLGWLAHWLLQRFNRVETANVAELDHMASALHEAEEARDAALAQLEARESELVHELNQTRAELQAAMDGLGNARREAEELRAYIEANS
ncbi:MAG: hypothetical protein Q9M41_07365 [Paracoccaceae bacterium]|nr:hypothetical protein [Paracoccaceae bacterium]